MTLETLSTIGKTSTYVGSLSGVSMVLAQAIPIPENIERWPVTALMALITLVSLGIATFCLRQFFKLEEKRYDSLTQLTTAITAQSEKIESTNKLLSTKQCPLLDKKVER